MSAPDRKLPQGWQRVCFRLQVVPGRIEEYRERHAAVWPEMLSALHESGWHNYSLFLDEDGTLIGYFETPSLEHALAGMAAREVNARWQAEMAEFFVDLDTPPDQGFIQLAEVFQLETQLERVDVGTPHGPADRPPSNPPPVKESPT